MGKVNKRLISLRGLKQHARLIVVVARHQEYPT